MAINTQPSTSLLHSAYRPILYQTQQSADTDAELSCNAIIEVTIDSVVVGTFRKVTALNSQEDNWILDLDISGLARDYLSPMSNGSKSDIFGALDGGVVFDADDNLVTLSLSITYEYEDEDDNGLFKSFGGTDATNTIDVVNACLIPSETDLDAYTIPPSGTPSPFKSILSRRPSNTFVRLTDKGYFAYHQKSNIDFVVVSSFDADGVLIERDYFPTNLTGSKIGICPCAPVNINAISNWEGSGVTIDENVSRYSLACGFGDGSPSFVLYNGGIAFKTMSCEETPLTIHFMGSLGSPEFFTFTSYRKIKKNDTLSIANRPLPNDYDISNRGRFVKDRIDVEVFIAKATFLDPDNGIVEWLASELGTEVEAYLDIDGEYIPCFVKAQDTPMSDINNDSIILSQQYEITLSNSISRQKV